MSIRISQTDSELVFNCKQRISKSADGAVIRVNSNAHEALLLWSAKTGLSVARIASEFILFAAERSRLEGTNE